ncbi:MAG: gas vesicle protein GvpN [Bacillota bacterium]
MEHQTLKLFNGSSRPNFVVTDYVRQLSLRAMTYVEAGFPVHFEGPSGTGKTTMAIYLAELIGKPVILIHGDEELGANEVVGGFFGYRSRVLVDNFVHTVMKTTEDLDLLWVDGRLTTACQNGYTLIYDEFTRSRPETNNILLSVLEEGLLQLPASGKGQGYVKVHPDFHAIFTSNPKEYAGVHKSQDALRDRMITIQLGQMDRETEIAITAARSGKNSKEIEKIVDLVRDFSSRFTGFIPTVRRSIMLAEVLELKSVSLGSDLGYQVCMDVLGSEIARKKSPENDPETIKKALTESISRVL